MDGDFGLGDANGRSALDEGALFGSRLILKTIFSTRSATASPWLSEIVKGFRALSFPAYRSLALALQGIGPNYERRLRPCSSQNEGGRK
jgi:hypothetical protein